MAYVVTERYTDEEDQVIGVFSSLERAKDKCQNDPLNLTDHVYEKRELIWDRHDGIWHAIAYPDERYSDDAFEIAQIELDA